MPKKTGPRSKWSQAPESLVRRFGELIAALPGAEPRKVFVYPAAFVNGNMFCGCHQENVVLRLGEEDRAKLLQEEGARVFEPMPGRPMKEYVVAPAATDTPMLQDAGRGAVSPRVPPIGRFVRPEEVAALTAFLLSDEAAAITGQQLVICGGASL